MEMVAVINDDDTIREVETANSATSNDDVETVQAPEVMEPEEAAAGSQTTHATASAPAAEQTPTATADSNATGELM